MDTLAYAGRVVPELSDAPPYCVIYLYDMCMPVLYYIVPQSVYTSSAAIYRTQSPDTESSR